MFVRGKHINGYTYLYLVESIREDGRAKQRIIKNLGRKEAVVASGELERLATSIGRYGERTIVLSQLEAGKLDGLRCKRIGAPLLFGRLWRDTGCRDVIHDLLAARQFEFPVEQAVFISVLHRIMVSGSDRACEKWITDYAVDGYLLNPAAARTRRVGSSVWHGMHRCRVARQCLRRIGHWRIDQRPSWIETRR